MTLHMVLLTLSHSDDFAPHPEAYKDNEYKLEANSELRFEVATKEKVTVEIVDGLAEIFGTELVKNKKYTFSNGAKLAVFTWHGCTLKISFNFSEMPYISTETPMLIYLNLHGYLEQMRITAEKDNARGPIALVVGPVDVGKSTLCRILLNYAVRLDRRPIYVELDVGQGNIAVPGTMGAVVVERPADPEDNFSQQAPLVYHFGHKSPGENLTLHNMLISRLAEVLVSKSESNRKTNMSGVVINTCGWVIGEGYHCLLHAAQAFEVDVVIVIDQERLYNQLQKDLPSFVKVTMVPKSGGVVVRAKQARAECRDSRVRSYFYGNKLPLYPHSIDLRFSDIRVYKIGSPQLPDSCMPLGMKAEDYCTKIVPVTIDHYLLNHILAVSLANNNDDDLIQANIAGFLCVTGIDTERQILTVLAPQPRPLPKSILLLSNVQFMDSH
ncbi:Polyribonucleotide 5'-hydroxyl-kinase Clp1 [Nymphon striatum]|nr:Polyribonucleotide 5'-hydroxyl-kinase Clp1 [Nymphon striatum]